MYLSYNEGFFSDSMKQKDSVLGWLAAFLLFAMALPYFLWEYLSYFNLLIKLPLYIILFTQIDSKYKDLPFGLFFGFIAILADICYQQNLVSMFFDIGLISVFVAKKEFLFSVYHKFWTLYVVTLSLSFLCVLLIVIGVSLPSQIIQPLNELKNYNYIAYPFLVIPFGEDSIRFNSVFDEPGVVGTFSFLFLVIEQVNLKRIGNIIILVAGIMSFSLFFYLGLGLYLIFRMITIKGQIKQKVAIVVLSLLAFGVVVTNETTQEMIVSRVEWDEDSGSISGDDRAHGDLKEYVAGMRGTDAYLWGVKNKNLIDSYGGSASIQNAILKYGFVVVALFFFFYALYSLKYLKLRLHWFFFMGVLFILIYNRPTMFDISRLFLYSMTLFSLFYEGIPFVNKSRKEEVVKKQYNNHKITAQ